MSTAVKTYTCGWCCKRHLPLADDGMLIPHRIPTIPQMWCDGLKTYRHVTVDARYSGYRRADDDGAVAS